MLRNYLLIPFVFLFSCQNRDNLNTEILDSGNHSDSIYETGYSQNELWIDTLNSMASCKSICIYDPSRFIKDVINDTVLLLRFKEISEENNNFVSLSYALNMLGKNRLNNSDYLRAIQYHKEAYETALNANDDYLEALSLNMMGVVYRRKSAVKTALEYYTRALKTAEKSSLKKDYMLKSIAISYEGIGGLHRMLGQYEKAIIYYKKSLEKEVELESLLGLSIDYHNIGKSFRLLGQYDSALYYHKRALEYNIQLDSDFGKSICYNNLGVVAMKQKEIDKAIEYFIPALELAESAGDSTYIVNSNLNLGWYYLESRQSDSARFYFSQAMKIAKRLGYKAALVRGYDYLSHLEQNNDNASNALRYYKNARIYSDSIVNEKNQQYLADLTILYDIEKKRSEIESLNRENEIKKQKLTARNHLIVSLILLVIVIISIAYFFRQRGIQQLNQMESELQKYLLKVRDLDKLEKNEPEITSDAFAKKYDLTDREAEVLSFISDGMSNADIAEKIFVSTNTIKYHIKNIYIKLDVKNRVEALNKIKQ